MRGWVRVREGGQGAAGQLVTVPTWCAPTCFKPGDSSHPPVGWGTTMGYRAVCSMCPARSWLGFLSSEGGGCGPLLCRIVHCGKALHVSACLMHACLMAV